MSEPLPPLRPPTVLEDPSSGNVAKVYADAFLDSAGADSGAAIEEYRSFVDDLLAQVPDLERLLTSPALSVEEHLGLIDRVVGPRATPLFTNFLRVLARHRRLDLLRMILETAIQEAERRAGRRRVQVRSATPLSAEVAQDLGRKLAAAIAAEPILETTVDPSLLGGLVVRVGDTVYDGSLRTRLRQLTARLHERCLHEIQRGRDRFSHPEGN
jgi:F-type H+-transporting ATPase subunit delta